jgi:predicted transcriptional regulator
MSRDLKYEKANIELRRGKVLELLSKGHSQSEIAKSLNVSNALISLDIQYIKEQAKKELETHIQERVPLEYKRAMAGLDNILKKANEMLEKISDPKTQIQNMSLLMDLYKTIMFLCTDGSIIERAMKKVQGLQPQQQSQPAKMSGSEVDKKNLQEDQEADPVEPEEDLREE